MKNQFQKSLLLFILLVSIFFAGCEKDLYEDTLKNNSEKIKVTDVSISNLDIETAKKINQKISTLKSEVNKNGEGKFEYNSSLGFYIDTENGKLIEKDGKLFYTFPIFRESEDKLENVVFASKSNGDLEAYLVKYDVTPEQYLTSANNENITAQFAKFTGDQMCINFISETTVYPNCDQPNGYHESTGLQCEGETKVTIIEFCSNNGGGGSDTTGSNTGSNSSSGNGTSGQNGPLGGGSGGGVQTDIGEIITVTTPLSQQQINVRNFILSLNEDESDWYFGQEPEVTSSIISYITLNNFSSQSQDFIKECINQIIQNPNVYNSIIPFIIEEQIDDSHLDPCGQSVLNRLKNLQQNDIATILSRLGNTNSIYQLSISTGFPTDPNALAATNWNFNSSGNEIPYNYNILIRPEETATSSDLAIAGSLLHEIIHSYFLSLIDDCHQANNCTLLQSFPDLWNFYVANQNGGIYTNNLSQHNQIASSYVNIMGAALQELVTGTPVQSGQPILQVYTDVAWYGLAGTIPFNNLSQADKDRMNFRFENVELLNQSSINQNGVAITPVGTRTNPCQ